MLQYWGGWAFKLNASSASADERLRLDALRSQLAALRSEREASITSWCNEVLVDRGVARER